MLLSQLGQSWADEATPGQGPPRRSRQRLRRIVVTLVTIIVFVVILLGAGLAWGWRTTPSVADLPTIVHASLARAHAPYTPLAAIPLNLQHGLIATEDERFYSNHGIDIIGLVRALWDDLRAGRIVEGGSTITQQLAKNAYMNDNDHTWLLKLEAIVLALKIDHRYRKGQILELYLNLIYFGDQSYGIGAAAQHYFHTTPSHLDLAQCAYLAGLPQAPSGYNFYHHPAAAVHRQQAVLNQMVADDYISAVQAQRAAHEFSSFVAAP